MSRIFGLNKEEESSENSESRKKISYLKFKTGEIVFQQDQPLTDIWVLYQGKGQLYRETKEKKIQSVIQLSSGQIYGITEMIVGTQKALLSMKISSTTTMVKVPLDYFKELLNKEPELLWNLTATTLTQVNRIEKFMNAAPFLIKKKEKIETPLSENIVLQKNDWKSVVKNYFGSELEESDLQHFKKVKNNFH